MEWICVHCFNNVQNTFAFSRLNKTISWSYTSESSSSNFGSPISLMNRSIATEIAQDAFKGKVTNQ